MRKSSIIKAILFGGSCVLLSLNLIGNGVFAMPNISVDGEMIFSYVSNDLWEGADTNLTEEEVATCEAFQDVLEDVFENFDDPSTPEGVAFKTAWENRRRATDYIGSMDSKDNVSDNLALIIDLDDSATYIIKERTKSNDGFDGYDLYITYENLSNYSYLSWVPNITKTRYVLQDDGTCKIESTVTGKARRNIYHFMDPRPSFDTESFQQT